MRMRIAVLILLAVICPVAQSPAQETGGGEPYFDAISFAGSSDGSTRLDVYLAVPYSAVAFERVDEGFRGRYQARITVKGNGEVLFDSTITRDLQVRSREVTAGSVRAYDLYQKRLRLPPGSYTAGAEILDLQSSLVTTFKRTITAVDYDAYPFALSGMMLVSSIREDSGRYVISPLFSENVSLLNEHYFLFFEVYNRSAKRDFKIDAIYTIPGGEEVERLSFTRTFPEGRSQQWLQLPNSGIARGTYIVELKVFAADDTLQPLAATQRNVRFEGGLDGLPMTSEDLEERITQLRYVANQSDIDHIREVESFRMRRQRYAEFWSKLDPTPGTAKNEAMEEYFRRIDYANRNFRSYAAGWLTDKGRVYVIYGQPDNINYDPYRNNGRGVETWTYYNRNLRFVFIDETGFGDFRLTTPLPLSEKYRYR